MRLARVVGAIADDTQMLKMPSEPGEHATGAGDRRGVEASDVWTEDHCGRIEATIMDNGGRVVAVHPLDRDLVYLDKPA